MVIPFNRDGFNTAARKTDSKQPENIDKEIIEILKSNGKISRKDLALILNKTEGSIRHHLNKLQEKGIIKHQGTDIKHFRANGCKRLKITSRSVDSKTVPPKPNRFLVSKWVYKDIKELEL